MGPAATTSIMASVGQLKLLDDNAESLPDYAETDLVAFKPPGVEQTEAALNAWLASQTQLTLKLCEVPSQGTKQATSPSGRGLSFPRGSRPSRICIR